MIRYLKVENLAVIESAALEFEQSFNILTGETGAGKSILVEAVGLLLGGRASVDLVRTGAELATVEAIFDDRGTEIVVRREVTALGRSRAFLSGSLATAGALKDLADRLVELHGQHEHQQLLDPDQHLPLLDQWAALDSETEAVAAAYAEVERLRQQLDRLRMDSRERAARLELVEFQWSELRRADLRTGEDEELVALRQILRSADTIQRLCAEGYDDLYGADESILARLTRVAKRVRELAALDPRFAVHLEQHEAIKVQLDDLATTLRDFGEGVDATPGRLEQVEERLALLERLKRKHGPTLDEVIVKRDALSAEHAALTGGGATPAVVEQELAKASTTFLSAARSLSTARRAAATRFADALQRGLAELAMEQTRFEVRLTTDERESRWSPRGIDSGEFYLSPNPGEDLRPLARIVSGGELSRVMLALKTMAAFEAGKTLIFDEVDAGIGGRVAAVVGEKLRALGDRFQVLCITHLPQIAAAGNTHFHIEKRVRAGRTVTSVTRLGDGERVDEIARMLDGGVAGEPARVTARELLARSRKAKAKVRSGAKAKG